MTVERTFVMIKPDGVQRNLVGAIVSRFEKKGLKIVAMKLVMISKALAEKNYAEHSEASYAERSEASYIPCKRDQLQIVSTILP